jgi:hypothetical protein
MDELKSENFAAWVVFFSTQVVKPECKEDVRAVQSWFIT